ncbi:MAG: proton-conducting membrane transporter [Halorhodospira halophila]|uniref:proton-conducting transporter transmembrane domain-containing protein n=1 Tax=Halorhodospira TaxID=85108 RepID=UPI0019139130|nr:proton-conducting transporter membrane subunit [Halorhodospira halophila]MCG5533604.1 proton-conducting membrane transporter [Halorhodospira sp. 9621]MCG5544279.1 proton-conducting membrane transporter [Halorhodospira sp. 9628]MBK5935448.1 proton-conducting membrane transporter [Halorhodospira halophila]MCC3751655.1 proton-conducting membrane transporter [Halorhodospira halophila]MCG5528893.1 proton-conducting membrane transporter [Halorhodospira halophila]
MATLSLPLAFFLPLLTALAVFLVRARRAPWLPLLGAVATVAAVADVVRQVAENGPQVHHLGGWQPPLGVELYADGLSALMLGMTALVGLAVTLYAAPYLRGKGYNTELFWPLWLVQWATLNGTFLSADLFNLYVMLELLTLTAAPLAAMAGDRPSLGAAMRYLLLALLGSLAYLLGVALLYGGTGTLHLREVGELVGADAHTAVAAALITAGLFAKAAVFPLHMWLMPAHSNAPAPASAALSALVAKAGLYLVLRLWLWVFPVLLSTYMGWLIGALGALAVLYGSLQALRQPRLKQVIAYSTIAQLGYLLLLLPMVVIPAAAVHAWQGVAYHALAHGFAKSAAFLAAGNMLYSLGHDRLEGLRGLTPYLSITVLTLGLAFASLMALPPSGGFLAKWLLLSGAISGGQWPWAVVIILGSVLAAAYAFRVLAVAHAAPPAGYTEVRPAQRVPRIMEWVPLLLVLIVYAMGVSAMPALGLLEQGAPEGLQ